ncbi:hypothetical protein EVAR_69602_1 [Eumeta japonica]|uniref:Uncharacterized protein n=1 Tax=Eumeta variegata TaxID=151549 RepID=A0A4C2A0X3_EUMVA|nr:hypothetical protein EVAR_69602_1 [Eumeta japonica]
MRYLHPNFATLLDDNYLRVVVALRLGWLHCLRITFTLETNGYHGLSCQRISGKLLRHHTLSDIIGRALKSANVSCLLESLLRRSDCCARGRPIIVEWERRKAFGGLSRSVTHRNVTERYTFS